MNTERELDQIIETWMEDRARGPRKTALPAVLEHIHATPQRRRLRLGLWFGLGERAPRSADDRDETSRTANSRRRRIMFTSGVFVSIAALALSATLLPLGEAEQGIVPGASDGNTYVVAADGSGDYSTISEAVEAAVDGDTIMVRPGTYAEVVLIDKSITLTGDGPREGVIIQGVPQPWLDEAGEVVIDEDTKKPGFSVEAITIDSADATLSNLTIVGHDDGGDPILDTGILIHGGAPTVERVTVVNRPDVDGEYSIGVDRSSALVMDSDLKGDVWIVNGSPTIADNVIRGELEIWCHSDDADSDEPVCPTGAQPIVRDNTLMGISIFAGASPLVTQNLVQGPRFQQFGASVDNNAGIVVAGSVRDTGTAPVVSDNTITGQAVGLSLTGENSAIIEDNMLDANGTGVTISGGGGTIRGNVISGSGVGVAVEAGGKATIADNRLESNDLGISLARFAAPVISGNVFCGNQDDMKALVGEAPSLDGNEVCPDETPAS